MKLEIYILLLIVCLFLSAFFSGAETAFFSLSPFHRERLQNRRKKSEQKVYSLIRHPRKILSTVLTGNMLVNITATSILTVVVSNFSPYNAAELSVPIMTVLLLVFGEITPKVIAVRWNLRIAFLIAPLINFFSYLFTPLRFVLEQISSFAGLRLETKDELDEADIRSAIDFLFQGNLSSPIKQALLRTLEIDKISADKIGVPMDECITVPGSMTVDELQRIFSSSKTPFAIVRDGTFVGVVDPSMIVWVEPGTFVSAVCRPALKLSRRAKLSSVLGRMLSNNFFWVFLVDKTDRVHSVVGLRQILIFLTKHG